MKNFSLLTFHSHFVRKITRAKNMRMFFLAMMLCSISYSGFATFSVTPATGGTGICPAFAVGGGSAAYTALSDITVTEGATSDLSTGTDVLTITAPAGWRFNIGALPTLTFTSAGDVTSVSLAGGVFSSPTTFTVDISTSGLATADQITISGLQVQATSVSAVPGNLFASLAGGLSGIVTGESGTNFGSLSLLTGFEAAVTITASPAGPVCTGAGVTFTPNPTNGGAAPSYEWFVNNVFLTTGSTFSISTLVTGDVVNAVLTSSLPCSSLTGAVSNTIAMTVVPLPSVHNVNGGGNYCAGGTGVTIGLDGTDFGVNYQLFFGATPVGATVAGNGNPINFDPQTGAGTYTVVASNASATGCTVTMAGSATVGITAAPLTFTVTGGGAYCLGGSGVDVTLTGSAPGVSYQLLADGVPVGTNAPGTGSAIDFGSQITAATYTAIATDGSSGCSATMTGSAIVAINPLPAVFSATGGGSFCTGGTGVDVTLSGSEAGVSYQLFADGAAVSPALSGTGGTVDFGLQTTAGAYTVVGTNSATGCTAVVGNTTVTVSGLPTVYNVLGGGVYCSGASGIDVSITGSDIGINYQLFRAGVAAGAVVAGTGNPLDFGMQLSAGDYTVQAIDATTACTSNMTGDALVTVSSLPEAFGVIGGGATCAGGFGINVSQVGSVIGVNYQLYLNGVSVGGPISGTGGFLSFGAETGAGTYTAIGTDATSGCSSNMADSAVVTLIPAPNAYAVTGGSIGYCVGGTGVAVGLANSDIGVNYQMFVDGSAVGGLVSGTGAALNFGLQTTPGTYTIIGTNATTFCDNNMTGSAIVTINSLPVAFGVNGGGTYCVGGTGSDVSLAASTTGVNYQLFLGAAALGSPVAGNGLALDFGNQTGVGTYTIVATDATTGCTSNMTGTAVVDTLSLPHLYNVTGGGSFCTGGTGVSVGLDGSDAGVTYQLFDLFTATGIPVAGTGSTLDFGLQAGSGFYTVKGTNTTSGCIATMNSGVAVTLLPLPTVFNVFGGGSYCVGGSGEDVQLNGSVPGVNYQLFNGTTATGAAVPGTGAVLDFNLQTAAGTYKVVATDASTACTSNMDDSAIITISTVPNTFAVTGSGTICEGSGAGVDIGLAGSETGLNYQLYDGPAPVGAALAGTGAALDFGFQTAGGTYTVIGTNATSTCTGSMTGSAVITVNAAPTEYPVIGGGAYCVGGIGLHIGLPSSDLGVSYMLYANNVPTGITLTGTSGALDFGLQTTSGTYTIFGTNPATGCTGPMVGSTIIAISPLPTAYPVAGGGNYCSGSAGADVSLISSDFGVNYQLYVDGSPVGTAIAGTGLPIDFGPQTTLGTYTVVGANIAALCTSDMSNSVVVTSSLPPNIYSVTGGGNSCVTGVGFDVSLLGSDLTATYQLFDGTVPVGGALPGSGGAVDFGPQSVAGSYTVVATDGTSGCTSAMSGSAVIAVVGYPVVDALTGTASFCQFSTTALSDATAGGTWSSDNTTVATVVGGTIFGVAAGTATISYTVTNSTGCATASTLVVTVLSAPTVAPISGSPSTCIGVINTLTDATPSGVWSSSNTAVATISGTGDVNGLVVGVTTISYTVTDPSGCSATAALPFSVGVSIPASAILPQHTATICHGIPVDLNVAITGGITGYTFQWFDSGIAIPGAILDTYETFTPGLYTVAVNNGGCTVLLTDTTNVFAPPAPVISYDTLAGLLFTAPSFVSYQWFLNDTLVTGATTNNVPYGTPGSYTVLVSDINSCFDTSGIFIILPDTTAPSGVVTYISGRDIKIYPNPATSVLHIDAPVKVLISISTPDGKVLIDRRKALSVNVSNLADGMYIISIYDENNNLLKTDKFVKMQ